MKRFIVTFVLLLTVLVTYAQNQDYKIKGAEAMKNLDYGSAKIHYEDGVASNCDLYSIGQLTSIWLVSPSMRNTMRSVMARSFRCLDERATSYSDTASMKLLIVFYENGIGTEVDKTEAEMWQAKLDEIRNPSQYGGEYVVSRGKKTRMEFFLGYAATLEAPYGITFGGVGNTVGWYLRFRTNMSSQNYTKTYTGEGDKVSIVGGIDGGSLLNSLHSEKNNTLIGTGGLVFKVAPSFYISAGGGYCRREYLREFQLVSKEQVSDIKENSFWAKSNGDSSFEGVALDLDGTFKIGKTFYGSLGCSMLNFKYVSANAGVGLFF